MSRLLSLIIAAMMLMSIAPQAKSQSLDVEGWLSRSGVRLVVVEFYATWCKPCMDAVPKWKRLHERYRNDGLRLIVVNTQDAKGRCTPLDWQPNDIQCDESGIVSKLYGGGKPLTLPSAFLWSWQGNLLVQGGHVGDVEAAVKRYLATMPRVAIEAGVGDNAELLGGLVRNKLSESGKIEVVAGTAERKLLDEIKKKSKDARFSDKAGCVTGEEMPANSLLRIKVVDGSAPTLFLEMTNAETGCLSASGTASWNPKRPQISVAEAVEALLRSLRRESIQQPGAQKGALVRIGEVRPATLRLGASPGGVRYLIEGADKKGTLKAGEKRSIKLPMRTQPYRVVFEKPGYYPQSIEVRLDESTPVEAFDVTLLEEVKASKGTERGWLTVKSQPENAEVYVDGVLQEGKRTPATLDVLAGNHAVRIKRKSYLDWTGTIEVPADGKASINETLTPNFAELMIKAEPKDAQIFLNGRMVGTGSYKSERQPAGGYALKIEAPLHEPFEGEIFVEPGQDKRVERRLQPRYGQITLDIRTEVSDRSKARPQVFVDGSPVTVTLTPRSDGLGFTGRLDKVPSGTREVEVQLKRFSTQTGTVEVTNGGRVSFEARLSARFGTLSVTSAPSGMKVRVNGRLVGTTPVVRDEDVGSHTVEVIGEDYHRPFSRSVLLREQSNEDVHAALEERLGSLSIGSDPPDAEIYVDGVKRGTAPLNIKGVRVGIRSVEARAEGYTPTLQELRVEEGQTRRALIELQTMGAVSVRCLAPPEDRAQVEIVLAGKYQAGDSYRFTGLPNGEVQVICTSPRGHSVKRRVRVRAGAEQEVVLDLTDPTVLVDAFKATQSTYSTTGWSLIGVAVAAGIAGGVTYGMAGSEHTSLNEALLTFGSASNSEIRTQALLDIDAHQGARNSLATAAIISFATAGVALTAGILSLALSPSAPDEIKHLVGHSASPLRFGLSPSPIGKGMTFQLDGSF